MEALQFLPLTLKENVECIIKKENFTSFNVEVKNLSTRGGNYMGVLREIKIIGKVATEYKEFNIFAKSIVHKEDAMQIYSITDIYHREMYVYNDLMKVFNELQKNFNVPQEKRFEIIKSFDETNNENILLENLFEKGYNVYYRMDVMTLDYAVLVVKELAKLHGLSFALEQKNPEYFANNIKSLALPFDFGDDWNNYVRNMFECCLKYLDDDVRNTYRDQLLQIVYKYPNYMKNRSSVCTLVHGDYKLNNIMVKESNGIPSKVAVLDYQMVHYGSPINDFLYFIFNGTDQEFRKNHFEHLKNVYHETLKEFLKYFNLDIQSIFSRAVFDHFIKEHLELGLAIQFFFIPFLFASENDVPDVTDDLSAINFKIDDRFESRLRGVVNDFIEWGYL